MAKKRKAPRPTGPAEPREVDAKDARLTVKTYKDVANSEDEYWENQDRIDFDDSDDGRQSKRRRQNKEEEFLEASDEEVFEEEESDEESEQEDAAPAKGKKVKTTVLSDEEMGGEEEEEGDEGWWGSSRKDYYNADQIETEADALEEEAEAKRLQAKKLAKMSEADFAFDESEWLGTKEEAEGEEDVITEKLNEVEITEDMGPEERYKLLQSRYPEFNYLAEEFRELQPILTTFQKEAEGKPAKSLEMVKFWTLGCYVASLASYFAILTSPARDSQGVSKTISPTELRDHEVMGTLMSCREAWLKVKELKPLKSVSSTSGMLSPPEDEGEFDDLSDDDMEDFKQMLKKNKRESKAELKAKAKKEAEKAKKARAVEQSLADLSNLLETTKTATKASKKSAKVDKRDDDERSDFGDEEILEAHVAKEKAARKKSLKFYTSQIVSKSAKRADAGRNAGGDDDIPYRERLVSRPSLSHCVSASTNFSTERQASTPQRRGREARQEGQQARRRTGRGRQRRRGQGRCQAGARRGGRVLRHGGAQRGQEEGGQGGQVRGFGGGQGRPGRGGNDGRPRRQAPNQLPDPEEQGPHAASQEGEPQPACQEEDDVRGEAEEAQERQGRVQGRRGQGRIPGRTVGYQDRLGQECQTFLIGIWLSWLLDWFVVLWVYHACIDFWVVDNHGLYGNGKGGLAHGNGIMFLEHTRYLSQDTKSVICVPEVAGTGIPLFSCRCWMLSYRNVPSKCGTMGGGQKVCT